MAASLEFNVRALPHTEKLPMTVSSVRAFHVCVE